jgi:transposase
VLKADTGSLEPQRGRKPRSPLEDHKDWLLALTVEEPDLTLEQTVDRIGRDLGLATSTSAVDRFYERHDVTFKKKRARDRAAPTGRG